MPQDRDGSLHLPGWPSVQRSSCQRGANAVEMGVGDGMLSDGAGVKGEVNEEVGESDALQRGLNKENIWGIHLEYR